jgi:N-acetylmuramoyl-L-alanine amidase
MTCRAAILLALALGGAGCAHAPPGPVGFPGASWAASLNHGPRKPIVIVIHATEQRSVGESLATLRSANAQGPVSAHYLVGRSGSLYQLVDEERRAWHAGGGRWGTITDLNSASIGIELDNDGTAAFPDAQIDTLLRLLADICERNDIPRHQVIAHADLAPHRKKDPGAQFPWARLAQAGFGAWPDPAAGEPPPGFEPWVALQLHGYPMRDPVMALRAFRLHYRGRDDATPVMTDADRRVLYGLVHKAWAAGPPADAGSPSSATP